MYDHWKTEDPDWRYLGPQPDYPTDEDEAMAQMLGVDLDEYLTNKTRDRQPLRSREWLDDDCLPF